jgi:hypothetical protein
MGARDAASESEGFASQERGPRMGTCDAASESKGFASQERGPRMGTRDTASESKGFASEHVWRFRPDIGWTKQRNPHNQDEHRCSQS